MNSLIIKTITSFFLCVLTHQYTWANPNKNTQDNLGKFHVIVVADTKDISIGSEVKKDLEKIQLFTSMIRSAINLDGENKIFSENFKGIDILEYLNTLKTNNNDTIFFYYSGHGFNNAQSNWPVMDLRSRDGLALVEVSSILKNKSPNLSVIIYDACNKRKEVIFSKIKPTEKLLGIDFLTDKLKHLFLESSGIILASSSSENELSYTTMDGSYFTNKFIDTIIVNSSLKDITWNDLSIILEQPILPTEEYIQNPQIEVSLVDFKKQSTPVILELEKQTQIINLNSNNEHFLTKTIPFNKIDFALKTNKTNLLVDLKNQSLNLGDKYQISFILEQKGYVYIFEKFLDNSCNKLYPNQLSNNPVTPNTVNFLYGDKNKFFKIDESDKIGNRNIYAIAFEQEVSEENLNCGQLPQAISIPFDIQN